MSKNKQLETAINQTESEHQQIPDIPDVLVSMLKELSFNPLIINNNNNNNNASPIPLDPQHLIQPGDQTSYYNINQKWPNEARASPIARNQILENGKLLSLINI